MIQNMLYYKNDRCVYKWWKKLFFFWSELSISNAHFLWKLARDNNYKSDIEFKEKICNKLLFSSLDNSEISFLFAKDIYYPELFEGTKKDVHITNQRKSEKNPILVIINVK